MLQFTRSSIGALKRDEQKKAIAYSLPLPNHLLPQIKERKRERERKNEEGTSTRKICKSFKWDMELKA